MKNLLIAIALSSVVYGPALAVEPKPIRTPEPAAPLSSSIKPDPSVRPIRYCAMLEPRTGSRIWDKVCQTRDAWLKQGFDPLARK